jgi:competence ComEA-like helix-hairpin-helix protein
MFLTSQEKRIFLFILLTLFCGNGARLALRYIPPVQSVFGFIDSFHQYRKVSVNKATHEQLIRVSFIGQKTASRIIKERERRGGFKSMKELNDLPGIPQKNIKKFIQYLTL